MSINDVFFCIYDNITCVFINIWVTKQLYIVTPSSIIGLIAVVHNVGIYLVTFTIKIFIYLLFYSGK